MSGIDKSRTYTSFKIHPNDSLDTKTEKNSINQNQLDTTPLTQSDFKSRVLFGMNSTLALNECFVDDYSTMQYTTIKTGTLYNSNEKCFSVGDGFTSNLIVSTPIQSEIGEKAWLNDFVIMADEVKPTGSKIEYYITNDSNEEFAIKLDSINKPFHFLNNVHSVTIKIVMTSNSTGESPRIYGLGVLYFDITLESTYGLFNPDLSNLTVSNIGTVFLVRDPKQDDKLVRVYDAYTNTYLLYNGDELSEVKSLDGTALIDTTLNYGDYVNSLNITEKVLLSITTEETADKDVEV